MPIDPQAHLRNRLLDQIRRLDRDAIAPFLEPVELSRLEVLEKSNSPIEFVYFPESGIASVIAPYGKRRLEVGPFGSEGMSGIPLILGVSTSPHETNVQVPGAAHRIAAEHFKDLLARNGPVRDLLLRYVHTFNIQTAQTLIAAAIEVVEVRLARWILLLHDRVMEDEINVTHDFVATMLSVRRPGLTVALHNLEGKHLIRSVRGKIVVRDRAGLEAVCGGLYGIAEAEYERVLGFGLSARKVGNTPGTGR